MKYLKFGTSKNFIVFLHGWGANKNSFLWTKDYFDDYSTLYVDFAGFGETTQPSRPYFVSDYVCELKEILNQFEIENLILVGHSFGGRVAIKYAFSFQFDYKYFALVLVDSAGLKPKRTLRYYINVAKYKRCKRLAQKSKKYAVKLENFGSVDYRSTSGVMRQTFVNIVNEDLSPYTKYIKCRTLLVWGRNDKETKLYMAKRFKRLIKNSELFVLDKAGHFSFLDKPNEFLIILDTFVKN